MAHNSELTTFLDNLASVIERNLIIVSGKGGVGKSAVSAAIALLRATRR